MIKIVTTPYPMQLLRAVCEECGHVLITYHWDDYSEYKVQKSKMAKKYTVCPKCGKVNHSVPKWEKLDNGDWMAKCKNGDFLIWKYGTSRGVWNSYKWRYRRYGGEVKMDDLGTASSVDQAKRAITTHEEWIGRGEA